MLCTTGTFSVFILSPIRLILGSKHLVLFVALSILVTGKNDETEEKMEEASNKAGMGYSGTRK